MVRFVSHSEDTSMIRVVSMIVVLVAGYLGWDSMEKSQGFTQVIHYEDGSVYREMDFDSHGKLHGTFVEFYRDGSVSQESHFSHGVWTKIVHYYPNGQKAHEAIAGSPDVVRDWDEEGNETTPPQP